MQDDGVIAVRGRQVTVLDAARLDAIVHRPAKIAPGITRRG
jgi:hypothetical protein